MKLSINKPELICWVFIPFLLLLGLLTFSQSMEVHLHDTYFVINNFHLGISFGILLGLLGLGYWIVNKLKGNPIRALSIIHLVLTLGGTLLIMLIAVFTSTVAKNRGEIVLFDEQVLLALSVIILSQPIYFINLIVGSLRRK